MPYFNERIFLDYLDHQTGAERSLCVRFAKKDLNLKFDVLAFPNAQFFVAAPAIAKCHDSAFLLGQYDVLWATNRLKYVLDPRYNGCFSSYVENRVRKLQSKFHTDTLTTHFEHVGYMSPHWHAFFNGYLRNKVGITSPHEPRIKSGDACFREETRSALLNDDFSAYLFSNTSANTNHILRVVDEKSSDECDLFQREALVRDIQMENAIEPKVVAILCHELNNSFSRANAIAVDCIRPHDVFGVNGRRLSLLARHIWVTPRMNLFDLVSHLSHSQVVELSQQSEWRCLISLINNEIQNKYLEAKANHYLINRHVISMLPSRYFGWLQEVATMIIAFILSPFWGSGAASRYVGSIFTNTPSLMLRNLTFLANKPLTTAVLNLIEKAKSFSIDARLSREQILMKYGLTYLSDSGFVPLAEAPTARQVTERHALGISGKPKGQHTYLF